MDHSCVFGRRQSLKTIVLEFWFFSSPPAEKPDPDEPTLMVWPLQIKNTWIVATNKTQPREVFSYFKENTEWTQNTPDRSSAMLRL